MPFGHGIEQLHVRFHFGLLSSCRVDVFIPAESEYAIKPSPLSVYSATQKDSVATLSTFPHCTSRTALALLVTGFLGEGHESDVLKAEARLLHADGDDPPTALMALKVSYGPSGLAALQAEYRIYKYLANQESRRRSGNGSQLIVPKAYGVFRFDMEGAGGGIVGGLLLSYEPGVPAWQLSVKERFGLR